MAFFFSTSNHMSRRRQQIRDISDDGRLNIVESFCFVHRNLFYGVGNVKVDEVGCR